MTAAKKNFGDIHDTNKTPQPGKVSGEVMFASKVVRRDLVDHESFDITFDRTKIDQKVLVEKPLSKRSKNGKGVAGRRTSVGRESMGAISDLESIYEKYSNNKGITASNTPTGTIKKKYSTQA